MFEIPKSSNGYGTLVTLASFDGTNGAQASGELLLDAAGNLFGVTRYGGVNSKGNVFEVASPLTAPVLSNVYSFGGADGSQPVSGLIADASGNLFGTAYEGGPAGQGSVFELSGTGFVPFSLPCFRAGTRIATPDGDRAVEDLRVGDSVLTAAGATRFVRWVGARMVACQAHPDPSAVWPVRVRAGAFGDAVPRRDLFLSPDHAIFAAGALIPIKRLIDGDAVAQVPVRVVPYHHIELETHDVLLAEGLPAESYLDTGDRASFDGAATVCLHPEFGHDRVARRWEALGCAPLMVSGPVVERVRKRLNDRARRQPVRATFQKTGAGPFR